MIKKLFCKHDWNEIDRYYSFENVSLLYKTWFVKLYCPKCHAKKDMKLWEYKQYLKIKEINERYKKG